MFDPAAGDVAEAGLASMVVWFDALIANVDRTARNPNLLIWHKECGRSTMARRCFGSMTGSAGSGRWARASGRRRAAACAAALGQ